MVWPSNLSSYSVNSSFIALLTLLSSPLVCLLDGRTYNHNRSNYHQNQHVDEGVEWSMEVDLRSREKEKRTLHWFVGGKQQEAFITRLPTKVEFGVCCIYLLLFIPPPSAWLYLSRFALIIKRIAFSLFLWRSWIHQQPFAGWKER